MRTPRPYDSELAFELFKAWKSGCDCVVNELFAQLKFLVGDTYHAFIGTSAGEGNGNIFKADAFSRLFTALRNKPADFAVDHDHFSAFCSKTAYNAMLNSIRDNYETKEYDSHWCCASYPMARLPDYTDVELALYQAEFQQLAFALFAADIRFAGQEKEACVFIGRCLLGIFEYEPTTAMCMFDIPRNKYLFLHQYVRLLLVRSYYAAKRIVRHEATGA